MSATELPPLPEPANGAWPPEHASSRFSAAQMHDYIRVLRQANVDLAAESERNRVDAERWRLASTSRNHGITGWHEFGQRTMYGKLAEEVIDAALKEAP